MMRQALSIFLILCLLMGAGFAASDKTNSTKDVKLIEITIDKTKEKANVIANVPSDLKNKIKITGGDNSFKVEKTSASELKFSKTENGTHSKVKTTVPLTEIQKIDTDNDGKIGYLRFVDGQLVEKKIVSIASITSGSDTIWNMEFSDVILNGWTGYFTKTGTSQLVSSTFTTSQTYASNKTSAVLLNISAPAYVSPYARIAAIPNITAWYRFDNSSGTKIIDWSGHGYNGTAVNGPTWVTGKYNNGLKFDGVNDYAVIPHASGFNSTGFTVCGWINGKYGPTTTHIIASKYIYANNKGWGLYVYGKYLYLRAGNGTAINTLINPVQFQNNTDYFFMMWCNGSHVQMYVNNTIRVTKFIGSYKNDSVPLTIGAYNSGASGFFNGKIDNIVILPYAANSTVRSKLFYDNLQQLQARTNANATYSGYWNSSSNNPITLPKKSTDGLINSLSFKVPVNMTDSSGITTYYYNQTVGQFTPTTTVYFTEDITKIRQSESSGVAHIDLRKTFLHNVTAGHIISALTPAGFYGNATLATNDSTATLSTNATHINIATGAHNIGQSFYYNVTIPVSGAFSNSTFIVISFAGAVGAFAVYSFINRRRKPGA